MAIVVLFDFNGYSKPGHYPVSMWAEYDTLKGVVYFGGGWSNVPDWKVKREPTEKQLIDYVSKYT